VSNHINKMCQDAFTSRRGFKPLVTELLELGDDISGRLFRGEDGTLVNFRPDINNELVGRPYEAMSRLICSKVGIRLTSVKDCLNPNGTFLEASS
jgi:hypothetical protein